MDTWRSSGVALFTMAEDNVEDVAINFWQLLREEKRRARKIRQQANQTKGSPSKTDDKSTDAKEAIDDQLQDWPVDWCSSLPRCIPDCSSNTPETVYYKSDFLNQSRRDRLVSWLQGLPQATSPDSPVGKWNTMKYAKRRVALFEHPLPLPLSQLAKALVNVGVFEAAYEPNHVLVNEYTADQGILPHTDGPLYFSKTATISIGSNVLLHFTPRLTSDQIGITTNQSVLQVLLEGKGSLVVFSGSAYSDHCHGIHDQISVEYAGSKCINAIEGTPVSRGHRISLTFRHKAINSKYTSEPISLDVPISQSFLVAT
jgi:alkylated DNA repair protein alkB family protein 6